MIHMRWRVPPGDYCHLIKISCERGSPLGLHTHDYPEIFWIEEGSCYHRINQEQEILEAGALVFIRAHDRHQFIAIGRRRFMMVNLQCHPAHTAEFQLRHPHPFGDWMAAEPRMPCKIQLAQDQLQHLQQLTLDFANRKPDALHFEAFLLDLARLLETPNPRLDGLARCPDWLRSALLQAQKPAGFLAGVAGLVHSARRSPEHVARVCRTYLQKTPTELIEQSRMTFAERELRLSASPVTDIALACGYATTAQFYRAFRRYYSRTPLRYRRWITGTESD